MALETVAPGLAFRPDAAASMRRIIAQLGRVPDVNRSVVSYETQDALYRLYLRGLYPYKVMPPWASNHVYRGDDKGGNAWDTDERGAWLEDHGWRAFFSDEPWHFEYYPDYDNHRREGSGAGGVTTPEMEWDEMATEQQVRAIVREEVRAAVTSRSDLKIVGIVGGVMYLTGEGGTVHIENTKDLELLTRHIAAQVGAPETFTAGQFKRITYYLEQLG